MSEDQAPPPFVVRNLPGEGQRAMEALAGEWRVHMALFAGMGTPKNPIVSDDIKCKREWTCEGRFLQDVTEGIFAGKPYLRIGSLAYNNVDQAFEWVTQDNINSNLMFYQARKGSGFRFPAELVGVVTDPGFFGEGGLGQPMRQRTTITLLNSESHTLEIYFTPHDGVERLVDRKTFTRA